MENAFSPIHRTANEAFHQHTRAKRKKLHRERKKSSMRHEAESRTGKVLNEISVSECWRMSRGDVMFRAEYCGKLNDFVLERECVV